MWKAYNLVNRKSTIFKRRDEEATKSNNEAKAKLFDKVLKGKFNSLAELQSFITQADASLKGQGLVPQIPQVP
jgi:superoxide dismutase